MIISSSDLDNATICGACKFWGSGNVWGCGSGKHGVLVECKGWCRLKKNKRKRWNYHPACNSIVPRERDSVIFHGQGMPTAEDVDYMDEQITKLINNGKK